MFETLAFNLDMVLLVICPYIALALFFTMTIYRYRSRKFSYSSLSSQFLENQSHFWALVPFHYGIIVLFAGHLIGFLVPRSVLVWNSQPLRLYILEAAALTFGILTFVGLIAIIVRRMHNPKLKIVTSWADWIVLGILLVQVFSGLFVALFHGWGSAWFAAAVSPYLWSLLTLSPNTGAMAAMPFMVKFHIVGAWVLIAFFPFTRLVHVLVVPNHYLWRKMQVVRWYGIKRLLPGSKARHI